MAMTPRLVIIRGRRADGGLALILDAVDVAESVRISIPTTGGQNCRCPASATPTWKRLVRLAQLVVASALIPPSRRADFWHASPTVDQAEPGRPMDAPLTGSRPRLSPA